MTHLATSQLSSWAPPRETQAALPAASQAHNSFQREVTLRLQLAQPKILSSTTTTKQPKSPQSTVWGPVDPFPLHTMVIFHKNCRSKGCFPSHNEERLFAKELPSLMCLCGPEASLPMTLNVPNPGAITITSYLVWSVNREVERPCEQASGGEFFLTFPSTPAISVTRLCAAHALPRSVLRVWGEQMTDWNPVIPGVVSVSTSHPEALVHKLADQVQASGHLTPQRLFFRNQKNVHGKEKR